MPKLPGRGCPKPLELYPYQKTGVAWLKERNRGYLGDDMGLGKTTQLLHATEGRTLIMAPKMVLTGGAWDDEIARWMPEQADRFTQCGYTSLNARANRKVLGTVRPEYEGPWDSIILDEAHFIKSRNVSWTKLLLKMSKQADRVYLASGSPIPNWAPELFTSLQMLHPEKAARGGELGSYWRWASKWFDTTPLTIYVGGREKEVSHVGSLLGCSAMCEMRAAHDPCEHYQAFAEQNLSGVFLRRLRDDVLTDLPPLTVERILTPMVPAQSKLYNQVRKEALAELADGSLLVAWAEASKHMMCEKIATGVEILDPTAKGASGKLERLKYDVESRTRPTLVLAHFQASVEAARAACESVGATVRHIHGGVSDKDRTEAVRLFKAGKLDVLVGSLETVAEGLTLTTADVAIFLETSYKPARNEQAKRRIHRPGQDRPCTILDYVTPDTVDERKRELLATKTEHQMRTLSPAQIRAIL
jgi:SNF2 family DNA or RNA helicase